MGTSSGTARRSEAVLQALALYGRLMAVIEARQEGLLAETRAARCRQLRHDALARRLSSRILRMSPKECDAYYAGVMARRAQQGQPITPIGVIENATPVKEG